MEIAFEDILLREMCEDYNIAIVHLGTDISQKLKNRLADLRAATFITDLILGNPHLIENTDLYRIDLTSECYITFCANHPKNKTTQVNWSKVRKIKLLRINTK